MLELSRKVGNMNIRDKLYIATYAENSLEVIRNYGIGMESNHICITECLDDGNTIKELVNDMDYCDCKDKLIIHGPFTEIIPMGIDRKLVDAGMERLNEAAEFAINAGSKRMVVHTGLITEMYYDVWHIEKSTEFWTRFIKDKPSDFKIYIENVFETSPEALREIIDNINDPRVGICLDVGHANAMKKDYDVYKWIKILGKRIKHFHIHNNEGIKDSHRPLGDGELDYHRVLESILSNCDEDVTYTIESMNCIDSIKWLEKGKYI